MSTLKLILLFMLFILLSVSVRVTHADRRYVSDMLLITLRAGEGREYRVIKTLKTDTPVEVLEESEDYLRVRTDEGEEGWVAKQYITSEVPKSVVIGELKKETSKLNARIEELEKDQASLLEQFEITKQSHAVKVEELEKNASNRRKEASRLEIKLAQITEKHNTLIDQSKNVVDLISEHKRLQAKNVSLNTRVEHLQKENTDLRNTRRLQWFLAGGGVFFIGWIVGKVSRKKKYY
ncbi:MAG: TIGR04211 family SH3 domain-containing protein [Deltaproteobacteria bacterium]|nr:TIGR04211 family SH3 domain-containing protein [Deltaproteobacteria bacterium]MBW2333856.1 TIGR04211 family SH3 domain-containing protein [Deltaproteobacteria bacterium]